MIRTPTRHLWTQTQYGLDCAKETVTQLFGAKHFSLCQKLSKMGYGPWARGVCAKEDA
jgi:hypothetical protein